MTELRIAQDIQRELFSIETSPGVKLFLQPDPLFSVLPEGAVLINSWKIVLGVPNTNAPYAVIGTSDNVSIGGNIQSEDTDNEWVIPVDIVERFIDYDQTIPLLGTHRQLIINKLSKPSYYNNLSGILAFGIRSIRTAGPIYDIIERYDIPEQIRNRYPIFVCQTLLITVEEKNIG